MHDNIQAAEWGLIQRELKAYVALVLWWEENKKKWEKLKQNKTNKQNKNNSIGG